MAFGRPEQVLGALRQLRRAAQCLAAHHPRWFALLEPARRDMVEHELAERTLQLRRRTTQQRETRAGHRDPGLEVETDRRADRVMLARLEPQFRECAAR